MNAPSVRPAEALLAEAARLNPGPWVEHSRVATVAARATQLAQSDLGTRVAASGVLERPPSTQEHHACHRSAVRRRGPLAGRRGAPVPGEAPSRRVAGENVTDAGRWCRCRGDHARSWAPPGRFAFFWDASLCEKAGYAGWVLALTDPSSVSTVGAGERRVREP